MAGRDSRGTTVLPERWLDTLPTASSLNVRIVRGEGAYVWDDDGERYLDLVTNGGATVLGHANPRVAAALSLQLPLGGGGHPDIDFDARDEMLEALSVLTPAALSKVVLTNSGSEAVEAALAVALAATRRPRVVVMARAFHGASLAASRLSDGGDRAASMSAGPQLTRVAFDDLPAVERALDERVAAVVVEPVQWEGGVRVPRDGYLASLQALCRDAGALLVVDEVMTALRTATPLLSTAHGTVPDLVCLGSSIGNGFPVGALVMTEGVADRVRRRTMPVSSTAGNPLACSAAAATLRTIAEPTTRIRIAESANHLQQRLRALRINEIKEVRGLGVMAGVELHGGAPAVAKAMRGSGVLVAVGAPGIIRMLPPLTIERRQIDLAVERLAAAIREVRQSRRRRRLGETDVELRGVAAPRVAARSKA
jgi:acetylornithine/LysW-gamma-L-lysine aminotransferase